MNISHRILYAGIFAPVLLYISLVSNVLYTVFTGIKAPAPDLTWSKSVSVDRRKDLVLKRSEPLLAYKYNIVTEDFCPDDTWHVQTVCERPGRVVSPGALHPGCQLQGSDDFIRGTRGSVRRVHLGQVSVSRSEAKIMTSIKRIMSSAKDEM